MEETVTDELVCTLCQEPMDSMGGLDENGMCAMCWLAFDDARFEEANKT